MGPSVALQGPRGPVLPTYAGISTRHITQEKAASQSVPTEGIKPAINKRSRENERIHGILDVRLHPRIRRDCHLRPGQHMFLCSDPNGHTPFFLSCLVY